MIGIDLGSNTLRLVRIDCSSGAKTAVFERIVRTAEGLVQSGYIGDAAIERIIAGLLEAREYFDFTEPVRAVTTEAMRRAANAREALLRIRRATGIAFEIIDADTEAALTTLAVRRVLQGEAPFLLLDIGGGSTEFVLAEGERLLSKSLPLGILTLAQRCTDSHTRHLMMREMLPEILSFLATAPIRPARLVATAGTPTTLAALKAGMDYTTYDAERINGTTLLYTDLLTQQERLMGADTAERSRLVGVGREELILTGIEIFDFLMQTVGFAECTVIDDGLREGAALDACRKGHI